MVAKSQTRLSDFTFTLEGIGERRCEDKQTSSWEAVGVAQEDLNWVGSGEGSDIRKT